MSIRQQMLNSGYGWAANTPSNRFLFLLKKDEYLVTKEWDNWDGTPEHATQINDTQCQRIESLKIRADCSLGLNNT